MDLGRWSTRSVVGAAMLAMALASLAASVLVTRGVDVSIAGRLGTVSRALVTLVILLSLLLPWRDRPPGSKPSILVIGAYLSLTASVFIRYVAEEHIRFTHALGVDLLVWAGLCLFIAYVARKVM